MIIVGKTIVHLWARVCIKIKIELRTTVKKKFKINIGYFEFSISGFSNSQDERVGNSNNFLFDFYTHPAALSLWFVGFPFKNYSFFQFYRAL